MSPMFSLFALALALLATIGAIHSQIDGCGADLSAFLPAPFNASGLSCRPMWNTFILRRSFRILTAGTIATILYLIFNAYLLQHSQNQDNILSIVLSSPYTSGWVGIAFSNDGMMTGSSAMVGWIGSEGRAYIKQFYLGGQTSSQVVVNKGKLLLSSDVAPSAVLYGASIYLAFQLKFQASVTRQVLLFAYSMTPPTNYRLTEHDDRTSVSFDFSAEASASNSPSSSSSSSFHPHELKRNHGALAMFGWGVLLPVGAIVARYFRQRDPLWYYLHVVIQFVGFLIGLAGAVTGIALYNRLRSNFTTHRGLGVFILVLGSLQVIAFFLRPDKESKIRRYWNWYHHWVGRLALFLAAVNIALGIQIGGAADSWKAVYGILLAIILISITVLEIALWLR